MLRRRFFAVMVIVMLTVLLSATSPLTAAFGSKDTPYEVVFSVPVGEKGVHYAGVGKSEMPAWGPLAFAVAPDGSFWIADTAADPDRLLHHSSIGELLDIIELDETLVGVSDLAVTSSELIILAGAPIPPKVARLTLKGAVIASYDLPEGLRLEDGLSGISLADQGQVLIERGYGASLSQLVRTGRTTSFAPLEGYRWNGRVYSTVSASADSQDLSRDMLMIGKQPVVVKVDRELGSLQLLGDDSRGGVFAVVDDIAFTPYFQVDQTVRHFSASGELLGIARIPEDLRYVAVEHELAIGPQGDVYLMLPLPDRLEIRRLQFVRQLESVLPPAPQTDALAQAPAAPAATCSRDSMMQIAASYTSNSVSLNSYHVNDPNNECAGRQKPHNLATGTYRSVPYDWGGGDTPALFNTYMTRNAMFAGDINVTSEGCSRGVDCSGFVSAAWGISRVGTAILYSDYSKSIQESQLTKGDILITLNSATGTRHVILFEKLYSTRPNGGIWGYESTTYGDVDKVIRRTRLWSWLDQNSYTPRRYKVCP
jgi:hypothetical protein